MGKLAPILVALLLLLSGVAAAWCSTDCDARQLAPRSCHHEQAPKVCDDSTATYPAVPDAGLPVPAVAALTLPLPALLHAEPAGRALRPLARPPQPPLRL